GAIEGDAGERHCGTRCEATARQARSGGTTAPAARVLRCAGRPGAGAALAVPGGAPGDCGAPHAGRCRCDRAGLGAASVVGEGGRLFLAAIAGIGALLLALPVAGVHMFTRRLRYDPSLVQAIIVLPIVVAGVVMVVKNSLPLAFALAGIVAGVRFRQKLEEPEDAVYVLLSLGIGLAAGVQALDVALAVSLLFNL